MANFLRSLRRRSQRAEGQDIHHATEALPEKSAQRTVVHLLGSMGLNRGGLTRAVYDRIRLLASEYDTVVASLAFQLNYDEVLSSLIQSEQLPIGTRLFHFHQWAEQNQRSGEPGKYTKFQELLLGSDDEIDTTVELKDDNSSYKRYFYRGSIVAMDFTDPEGHLKYREHYSFEHAPLMMFTDEYDREAKIRRRTFFNSSRKPNYRIFYNSNGGEYLSHWVNDSGYEYRAVLYSQNAATQYTDLRAVHRKWLKALAKRLDQGIMISDEPSTAFVLRMKMPTMKMLAAIHTTHYANHKNDTDGFKGWFHHYASAVKNVSKFVLFTDIQRKQIEDELQASPGQCLCIPHAAPTPHYTDESKDLRFVVVSRLDKDKRVEDSIKAFSIAVGTGVEVTLDIYGSGSEQSALRDLVKQLNISEKVSFHGYTSEPLSAYEGAAASVVTSKYEGFGLVVTESFSRGTPVIAYSVNYGINELIDDGINGVLVDDGNVDSLAKVMFDLCSESAQRSSLRTGALETARRYSQGEWSTHWKSTIAEVFDEA